MFTVRVISMTDMAKPVQSRITAGFTKKQALSFIERLGKLHRIDRFNKEYVVTPAKR